MEQIYSVVLCQTSYNNSFITGGIHALIRCCQRRSCQPFCLVVGWQKTHQFLELVAPSPGGTLHQKLLHQLDHNSLETQRVNEKMLAVIIQF